MKVREIVKILENDGWILADHDKTSHAHYKHPVKKGKISVPIHGNKDLKKGTASAILKQAGLKP